MPELLQLIVIIALWCWGFWNAFQEGQIFGKIGDWWRVRAERNKTLEYWLKPIIGCMICMPSVHGTILYLWFNEFDFVSWIVTIVCASGLNFVINQLLPDE